MTLYSIWFKRWEDSQGPAHWEHSFFRHKRLEKAITVCEQAGYDAAQEGFSIFDSLHDATNASASTTPEADVDTIRQQACPVDHPRRDLFLQRQRNACVDVQAADGIFQIRPTVGNLIGDRFIPSVFSLTYRSQNARRLLRKLPWLPRVPSIIDISTVAFADDVRVRTSSPPCSSRRANL